MTAPSRSLGRSILRSLDGGPVRAAKNLRNELVDRWFRSRHPDDGRRLAGELSARGVRHAVFTVAFNGPWVLDLLTSGWGRHQPAGDSNNLFGIKADAGWRGAKASSETREVRDGVERSERADFRRYDSAAESLADYVRFLRGNPRYARALAHGGDAVQFAQGLQKAGYATDPRYASKLLGVIERVRSLRAA